MAALESMTIQGIRSFSPEQENSIKFKSPITIITGQNGAGKTTIIECLRFMATGARPPNSLWGAFVTDPKLTGTTEVKARVMLQFRNYKGESICATRLLQTTLQANGQISKKSLDSNLSLRNVGSKSKSISSRCLDHDREMLRQLGVSKSILSSVIFCHQEESHWPLAESKELKSRFDSIFEMDRFTKFLEELKSAKAEFQNKTKLIENDLSHMGDKKRQVDDYKFEITSLENVIRSKELEVASLGELIEAKELELKNGVKILEQAQEREIEYKTKLNNLENVEQNICSYAGKFSMINPNQEVDVLKQLKEDHGQRVRDEERLQESREREQKQFEGEQTEGEAKLKRIQQQLWGLEEKRKNVERLRSGLKDLVDELSFLMSATSSPLSSPGGLHRGTISRGKSHLHLQECELKSLLSEQEAEEKGLVSRKEDLLRNQAKQEQTCKLKEEEKRETENNLSLIREEIGSCQELEDIQESIDIASDELLSLKASRDLEQIEADISQLAGRRQEQERRIPGLERERAELDREIFTRRTIENYKREMQLKHTSIAEILSRINPELESMFAWTPPQSELEEKLAKLRSEQEEERKTLSSQLETLNKKLSESCARKKMCEQQVGELREGLDKFTSSMRELCGDEAYADVVESVKQECQCEQDKLMTVSSSKQFYKECQNFIQQRQTCPVCKRAFPDIDKMYAAIESLEKRVNLTVPRLVSQQENQLSNLRAKLEKLQKLSGTQEEMVKVEKEMIPNLQGEYDQLIIDENRLSQEISLLEKKLKSSQSQLEKINSLIPDVRVLREKERECIEIESKISLESGNLRNPTAAKSVEEVKSQLQKAQRQVKLLDSQIEDKQNTKISHQNQIRSMEQQIHELKTVQLEQQKRRQKQSALLDKRVELEKKLESLDSSIKEVNQRISPIKTRILKFESELREKHIKDESSLNLKRQQIEQFKSLIERINLKQKEVDTISSESSQINYDTCLSEVKLAKERVTSLNFKYEEMRSEINRFSNEIINARNINCEYRDAIILKGHKDNLKKLKEEIEKLQKDVGNRQISKIHTNISQIETLLKTKRSKRDKLSGELQEKQNNIDKIKRNLDQGVYREIEHEYNTKKFELNVIQALIRDYETMYKTVDRSIMQFHKSKIDQINATLQDLWPSIYKGSDIDYIQITADNESTSGASGRCSYHYRVVMMKGDIELDMRGRCSAGQKLLACILIRLALAETFCRKCGIIALDEPTTNLDHKNMISLANALVSLLEKRSQLGSNFQMILITHEHKFVEAFEHSEAVEHYWELTKSAGNFSTITKRLLSRSTY